MVPGYSINVYGVPFAWVNIAGEPWKISCRPVMRSVGH
jgi:hypothetical protein